MDIIEQARLTEDELEREGFNKHSRSHHSAMQAARKVAKFAQDKLFNDPVKRPCKECGGTKTTTAYYAELVTGARIQENCPTCKGKGEEVEAVEEILTEGGWE